MMAEVCGAAGSIVTAVDMVNNLLNITKQVDTPSVPSEPAAFDNLITELQLIDHLFLKARDTLEQQDTYNTGSNYSKSLRETVSRLIETLHALQEQIQKK